MYLTQGKVQGKKKPDCALVALVNMYNHFDAEYDLVSMRLKLYYKDEYGNFNDNEYGSCVGYHCGINTIL